MQLYLARQAQLGLDEILAFIAQDSPQAAAAMLARIDGVIQRLVTGDLQRGRGSTPERRSSARMACAAVPHLLPADEEADHDPAGVPPVASPDRNL